MNLTDWLSEIKNLDAYLPAEWQEYVGYFAQAQPAECENQQQPAQPPSKSLAERIKCRKGAAPATPNMAISPKIVNADYLCGPELRSGITLGVVSGCYDLLHLGHVRSMFYAKKFLGFFPHPRLCALTLSDETIRDKKGAARPILDLNERLEMLCGVACVDYVIPLKEPNCLKVLEKTKPDYFFKATSDDMQGIVKMEVDLVESHNGAVVYFYGLQHRRMSTSSLIDMVLSKSEA